MMSTVASENQVVAELRVQPSGEAAHSIAVHPGDRLFVGSDDGSEICLKEDGVAAIHSLITADESSVSIQDYYSEAGTIVNGERVRQGVLPDQAEVRVGSAVIKVALRRGTQSATANVSNPAPELPNDTPQPEPPSNGPLQQVEDLQLQLEQAQAENEVLLRRLSAAESIAPGSAPDPFQEEMIELLRAEVLELQTALAERDENQTSASPDNAASTDDDERLTREESERLVSRLEQLLNELQQRDEQIATLTELLDSAESAQEAEQEERGQLNSWLNDIEDRFGSKEMDWQSERERLQSELQELRNDRERLEQSLTVDGSSAKLEAAQQMITRLRETNEAQKQQLQQKEVELQKASRALDERQQAQSREERVNLAEERAELSRQRQQLEADRRRLTADPNDTTLKLKALRQHLNEIHEQERQEKKEQDERKLSRRIAKLWNRLDG